LAKEIVKIYSFDYIFITR